MQIVEKEADALGIGKYVQLSIGKDTEPNLFAHDLNHDKINGTFSDLPLTPITEGVRNSLKEFLSMAEKGILDYSTAGS